MNKVAELTIYFWIMKICATTLGETAGDLLSMTMNVGYALSSVILLGLFAISLMIQLKAKAYYPVLFWTVILTTSTAGTTISDYMDRTLGLGYATGSVILILCLATVLLIWFISERSISTTQITSRRVECFYWAAILVSNTLGTAFGDFVADDSGLGFLGSAILTGGSICLIVALTYLTKLNRVLLFWAAFILTRPFGATFGDFLTKPIENGGLNFGTIGSSLVLSILLIIFVTHNIYTKRNMEMRSVL